MTRRSTPTVTAYPDGPLIVRGDVDLVDENGESLRQSRHTVALCRCGASAIKPWCDGTHKITGFSTGTPDAAPGAD
ncbi:MAG: CDGSH iron-sulfur domain-containing protein [Microbacterium sp.]